MSRSAMDLHRLLYPTAKKPDFYHSFCLSTNNIAEETRFLSLSGASAQKPGNCLQSLHPNQETGFLEETRFLTRFILYQWHFVKISKDRFQLIFTDLGN